MTEPVQNCSADIVAPPSDLAARIKIYLEDRPGDGGHSDAAGSNCWELLSEALEELSAVAQPVGMREAFSTVLHELKGLVSEGNETRDRCSQTDPNDQQGIAVRSAYIKGLNKAISIVLLARKSALASRPSPAATVDEHDPSQYCCLDSCKREGCTRLAEACLSKKKTADHPRLSAATEGAAIEFEYTNWEGRKGIRQAIPLSIRFGKSEWHPVPQWLLLAYDIDRKAEREFAMSDMQFEDGFLPGINLAPNEPQTVAWPPIALGDTVYMNERSPYFHDWKVVSLKVVSLRIDPDGKPWVSVIEGEQRHRGNGVYDAETTDIDAEHLSPLSRPQLGGEK